MYSSSYSRAKFGLESREPLHQRRGKSCGYYMRIIFFFSSLIQSLIIVSLVLFLIYGQPEKSAQERKVEELQRGFNSLSDNIIKLRKEKEELGAQLGARIAEKAALMKDLELFKTEANKTEHEMKNRLSLCERQLSSSRLMMRCPPALPPVMMNNGREMKTLQSLNTQQKAMINLIEANFTQMVQYLSHERDSAIKDRDTHHQDAITLRKENVVLKEQLAAYTIKCKEDFAVSLNGIQEVTSGFLNKINDLFPHQLTFHLTCNSQKEQMENIRNSCTNLSREIENKFQLYLDNVGNKVAAIQAMSSRLAVEKSHLKLDLTQCERKHSETTADLNQQLQLKQKKHDEQMEPLLLERNRLRDEKKLQEESLARKETELQLLRSQPNCKPGLTKPGGLLTNPQQNKQNGPNWPHGSGLSKTTTVR
ncbi:plasmalemma vesicle associated protein b [Neosynchiropus ocellatus]